MHRAPTNTTTHSNKNVNGRSNIYCIGTQHTYINMGPQWSWGPRATAQRHTGEQLRVWTVQAS